MKLETYTLPAYWASYLINGDASGLDDKDQADCDSFVDSLLAENTIAVCVDCSEEQWFSWTNDSGNGLGGDVLDYVFDLGND